MWLRHLIYLNKNSLLSHPKVIAEIGPGDSLGIGLAALITGAEKYYAFDIIKHSDNDINLKVFEDLLSLFRNKCKIPDIDEFPSITPKILDVSFPFGIISEENLEVLLNEKRVNNIRQAINSGKSENIEINYKVPWLDINDNEIGSIDLIFSQAVLEHVNNLEETYSKIYNWLKNGGYISHEIDYSSHETHVKWDGHRKYNKLVWNIIMHGRSYPINRMPHSYHVHLIEKMGFNIINEIKDIKKSNSKEVTKNLTKYFQSGDFIVKSALIQAKKNEVLQ